MGAAGKSTVFTENSSLSLLYLAGQNFVWNMKSYPESSRVNIMGTLNCRADFLVCQKKKHIDGGFVI